MRKIKMRKIFVHALPGSMRGFMSVRIMHGLTMKLSPMIDRVLAARGHRSVISLPVVQTMIHMAIETIRPMEPGSSTDEHATCEPLRTVISVRSAVVRGFLIVSVWAYRSSANLHRNLSWCAGASHGKQARSHSRHQKVLQSMHSFFSPQVIGMCSVRDWLFRF